MTENDLFSIGLLKLCEDLRMSLSGAGDPWPEEKQAEVIAYLEKRLENWKKPIIPRITCKYDECVRQLVLATLEEVKLWQNSK